MLTRRNNNCRCHGSEENGFRNCAIKSVTAAYEKTLEMQKK